MWLVPKREIGGPLRFALLLVGFTSVIGQIVLLRELLTASLGNELSLGLTLALWLLWTAAGSALGGRLFRRTEPMRVLAGLQALAALALPLAIYIARSSRSWWNLAPGEAVGPLPIALTAAATLAAFSPVCGWLFTAGARAWSFATRSSSGESCNSMYLFEAVGSALGGVVASLVLLRAMNAAQIAYALAAVNLLSAACVGLRRPLVRALATTLALALCAIAFSFSARVELRTASAAWPGFGTEALRASPYGALAVIGTEGNRSVLQNGVVLFTVPDLASAEESVHFAMAEHAAPRRVLLIGAGLNGSLSEILRYSSVAHVDYVEPDPALLAFTREHFPHIWNQLAADPRMQFHSTDGRLFLKFANSRYDVIIVALPEPQTAQLNRFYTAEFFREVAAKLAPGGLFAFQVHGAEEYLSPLRAEFLRCLEATLRRAFSETAAVPGETIHFLATNSPGDLTLDPQVLAARLQQRGIQTSYISAYYLPYRMSAERVADLRRQLAPTPGTRINRDFSPVAYYFGVALWSTQFSSASRAAFRYASQTPYARVLIAVLALGLLPVAWCARRRGTSLRTGAGLAVAATGLTMMAVEILLLLGFQAIYGYVFDEIAVIVAAFMGGLGLGAWLRLRFVRTAELRDSLRRLVLLQLGMLMAPLLASGLLFASSGLDPLGLRIVAHGAIPLLAIACGIAGGIQFSAATQVWLSSADAGNPGGLYALDLLGASGGAAVISIFLLPVFGFAQTATLVAVANVGPALLLLFSLRRGTLLANTVGVGG